MKPIIILFSAAAAMAIACCGSPKAKTQSPEVNLENLAPALEYSTVTKEEMLDMLLDYLAIESRSEYLKAGDTSYPITKGQIKMAEKLKSDAEALGAETTMSEWYYVYVDVPSNIGKDVPVLGFSCHFDYSPEVSGFGIKPQVTTYLGGDIILDDGSVISPDDPDGKDLPGLMGKTLIHTDGRTLLGGDDKNGCTILMSILKTMLDPDVKHGRIQFVFCPNEDIGEAQREIDSSLFNPDILFDVDGMGGKDITASNFTARGLSMRFTGHPTHPAEAKALHMGDPLAAAAAYIAYVPLEYRPERTEGEEGYIHHYQIDTLEDSNNYCVTSRIRYFDKSEGELFDEIINNSLKKVNEDFPYVKTQVISDEIQYDNVKYSMHPASHEIITRAAERAGIDIDFISERGGTTAAMFAAKSLRGGMCVFSGQHNCHSYHEFSCLEEMMDAYNLLLHVTDEVANMDQ